MATWSQGRVSPATGTETGKEEFPLGESRAPFQKAEGGDTGQADTSWAPSASHGWMCGCQSEVQGAGDWEGKVCED